MWLFWKLIIFLQKKEKKVIFDILQVFSFIPLSLSSFAKCKSKESIFYVKGEW